MLGPPLLANGAVAGASRNNCSTGSNAGGSDSANAGGAAIAIRLTHVVTRNANRMANLDPNENRFIAASVGDTSIKET